MLPSAKIIGAGLTTIGLAGAGLGVGIVFASHMEKFIISLENLNKSGVYALICMGTNKQYIGSSVKLGARFLDYMQPAYLGRRPNSPLLKAILKYGYINFCFAVLETCKPS